MLRWLLRIVIGLVVLVVLVLAGGIGNGWRLTRLSPGNPPTAIAAATDTTSLERGRHLSEILCAGCHGAGGQLPLTGSSHNMLAIPDGPTLGMLHAPNLTKAGGLANATDGELGRAIREGVGRDGHALLVMPSLMLRNLSDRDLACILGYLRSLPEQGRPTPPRSLNPLGYATLGFGIAPLSHQPPVTGPVPHPSEAASADYGEYLARVQSCGDCHGGDLRGGQKGQLAPLGPDLVALASTHSLESFDHALRNGVAASDGRSLRSDLMPWPTYAHFTDLEVAALHAALRARAGGH